MTTTKNNEHNKLNFSSEREQSQACLNSAEHEKNQGRKVLNVPNLRFPEFQGEWEYFLINDVCSEFKSGKNIKADSVFECGEYPVYGGNGLRGYTSSYNHEGSYVLIGRQGALCGNVRSVYGKTYITEHAIAVAGNEKSNTNFLHYLFLKMNLGQYSDQSAQPGLAVNKLLKLKVALPIISEQTKIAKLLSLLDERIATQNKIIDKLQSLIKGINQRVFMNNGINYKLGEVCEIRSGYSGNQLLSKKGLKVSRIETISGHKVNLERVGYVAPFESSENYKLQVGDILFSNINSVEYIGNTAFIDKDYDLYHGMNLLRLTPNNMVVIPFYLYLLLNTNRMLNRFKTVCNKAVSQASINQTELGKTVVQIPDINAQKQICELYQALYDKLESEKYANSLFQKQKQYLLRQMFI